MENLPQLPPEDHLLTDHTHDGGVKDKLYHAKSQLRANPAKWAGIAAGAGFVLGIIGRIMRHRMRTIPHIIVVEGA
jgi:hypothetical protein